MRRVKILVLGKVQNVFFRKHVEDLAISLEITGYVKNLDDGSVEIVAEGEDSDIEELINFCNCGPIGAEITKVDVKEEEYVDEFEDFSIRH